MGGPLQRYLGFESGAITEFFGIILYVPSVWGFAIAVASVLSVSANKGARTATSDMQASYHSQLGWLRTA